MSPTRTVRRSSRANAGAQRLAREHGRRAGDDRRRAAGRAARGRPGRSRRRAARSMRRSREVVPCRSVAASARQVQRFGAVERAPALPGRGAVATRRRAAAAAAAAAAIAAGRRHRRQPAPLPRSAAVARSSRVASTRTVASRRTSAAAAGAFADHHAAEHDRLGPLVRRRREAGDDFLRDLVLDEALDVAQEAVLVDRRPARSPRPASRRGRCGRCGARSLRGTFGISKLTTCGSSSMSMPRAAMSVATSTCRSPFLKSASALVRARLALVAVDRHRRDAVLGQDARPGGWRRASCA